MSVLSFLFKNGLKATVQKAGRRLLGIEDYGERLDTLKYFIDNLHECSDFPKAKDPDLRIMQKCDAELLRIFHDLCVKNGAVYWLDFGTLLGAERHGGFIPWDDDMDVAMLRDDYNKMAGILKDFCDSNKGFETSENKTGRCLTFSYNHTCTGIWLDIFPVDFGSADRPLNECLDTYRKRKLSFDKWYKKQPIYIDEKVLNQKRDLITSAFQKGEHTFIFHGPEFDYPALKWPICEYDLVFPLRTIKFEDYVFYAPKDKKYLSAYYGSNYMKYPKVGILHHDYGRGALSTWAKRNGIDMSKILSELKEK